MSHTDQSLTDFSYTEGLYKYSEQYILKKKKTPTEIILSSEKRYVVYARKSTEDDKRQVYSIEDQIEQCNKYAEKNNLQIVSEPIREEKSAKTAGKREQFNIMLERLRKGDLYNCILAWHPDRLARNMKESGEILDMLDTGLIIDLQFPSFTFNNDAAGKMTLSILFAMAKEFSDKLSIDTIRGIEKKIDLGKYCGSDKRGYYNDKNDYFREGVSFKYYKDAWSMYLNGKSQKEIVEYLTENGEKIDSNALSYFFRDPFSAGVYCYGKKMIDITEVDKRFVPQVSRKDFLLVQKVRKPQSSGWRKSINEKPFYDLMKCSHCGSFMIPGVSEGHSNRYLSVTCVNSKCKEIRKSNHIKPIANTIRGKEIVDFAVKFLESNLKIGKNLYEDVKNEYMNSTNQNIKSITKQMNILKVKLGKLEANQERTTEKLLSSENREVTSALSNNLQSIIHDKDITKKEISEHELRKTEIEFNTLSDFPKYEDFVNFFENLVSMLNNTSDYMVYDQIVKLLFVNISVDNKKIVTASIREPFNTYSSLKFLSGVRDGI